MNRPRHIDTERVIDEVRKTRCLWDPCDMLYKNRDARNTAWENIAVTLFGNDEEDKKELAKQIQQRWKTARDAYMRSRSDSTQPSGKKIKKYIYFKELSFLKTLGETEESLNSETSQPSDNNTQENIVITSQSPVLLSPTPEPIDITIPVQPWTEKRRYKIRKKPSQESDKKFELKLLRLLTNQTPDIENDDLAFFNSLGPILKSFSLEQKIEFRSRVLRAAMEVKTKGPVHQI